jgi:hypothetical protein
MSSPTCRSLLMCHVCLITTHMQTWENKLTNVHTCSRTRTHKQELRKQLEAAVAWHNCGEVASGGEGGSIVTRGVGM